MGRNSSILVSTRGCTRFVSSTTTRSRGGSISSAVPVNPVCPKARSDARVPIDPLPRRPRQPSPTPWPRRAPIWSRVASTTVASFNRRPRSVRPPSSMACPRVPAPPAEQIVAVAVVYLTHKYVSAPRIACAFLPGSRALVSVAFLCGHALIVQFRRRPEAGPLPAEVRGQARRHVGVQRLPAAAGDQFSQQNEPEVAVFEHLAWRRRGSEATDVFDRLSSRTGVEVQTNPRREPG